MVTVVWNLVAANKTHRRNIIYIYICFKSNQCPFGFQMTYECHPLTTKWTDQRLRLHSNGRWHSIVLVWPRLYTHLLSGLARQEYTDIRNLHGKAQTNIERKHVYAWRAQMIFTNWLDGGLECNNSAVSPGYLLHIYLNCYIYIYLYSCIRGDEVLPKGIFTSQYKDSVMTLMCVLLFV